MAVQVKLPPRREVVCKTCPFYLPYGSAGARTGQCRRFPPQVNLLNDDGGTTDDWPDMSETAWCGEHPDFRVRRVEAEAGKDA